MPQLVEYEGTQHEFPDDFGPSDIARALSTVKNAPPEDVSAGMALRGIPVLGNYVPQAEAVLRTGSLSGPAYEKELAERQRQYRMAEQNQPWLSTGLKAGGAVAPFALAAPLAGVGTALGVAPGMSVGGRIAAGGLSNAGLSAADAYVRGEDPAKAAAIGGGLGVALPAIGAGVGQAIRGEGVPAAQALAGRIGREAATADFPSPSAVAPRMAELGPQGFAGEGGANTRATLQGLVTEAGPARQRVTEAFTQRGEGARQRIEDAITSAFGPRQDLAELSIGERLAQGIEASPLYDAFRSTQVKATPEIGRLLPVLQEDGLLADAAKRMRLEGRPTVSDAGAFTTEAWDYVKRAVDGRIGTALRAGDRDMARIYTGLKQQIDQAIATANPDAARVWKMARDTWGSREGIMNAREEGQRLWQRNVRRDQLRQELVDMSLPERIAFREGARDSLAEMIDASVNGDMQVARMLRAPANKEKAMMLGRNQQTAAMLQAAEREAEFANFQRQLLANSQTAIKQEAASRLRPPERDTGWLRSLDLSKPGTYLPFVKRGYTNWAGARDTARYQTANDELARALLQQGPAGEQSLLRLMQPPPVPPPHSAARVGAYGAGALGPFY